MPADSTRLVVSRKPGESVETSDESVRDPRGARPSYLLPEIEALRAAARPYWRGVRTSEAREAHRRYSLAVANIRECRSFTWVDDDDGWTADEIRLART